MLLLFPPHQQDETCFSFRSDQVKGKKMKVNAEAVAEGK
jgi:hypothetical protein